MPVAEKYWGRRYKMRCVECRAKTVRSRCPRCADKHRLQEKRRAAKIRLTTNMNRSILGGDMGDTRDAW